MVELTLPAFLPWIISWICAEIACSMWWTRLVPKAFGSTSFDCCKEKDMNGKILRSAALKLVETSVIGVVYELARQSTPVDTAVVALLLLSPSMLFCMTGVYNSVVWEGRNMAYYFAVTGGQISSMLVVVLSYHAVRRIV